MSIDIILPTYNNLADLKRCLEGLSRQTCREFRAIICIDGSTDGTAEYLAANPCPFPHIVLQHPDGRNHGRNPTRNLALPHLAAEHLLLFDTDALPAPDLIEAHLRVLAGREVVSQGTQQYTDTGTNIWARYLMTRGINRFATGSFLPYLMFISYNAAMPTRFFTELGGQDAAMTRYGGGDTEFGIRLYERFHCPFINNTGAIATAVMGIDLDGGLAKMTEYGRCNLHYLEQKHPSQSGVLGVRTLRRLRPFLALAALPCFTRPLHGLLPRLPFLLQRHAIRYLVVMAVFRGFFTAQE